MAPINIGVPKETLRIPERLQKAIEFRDSHAARNTWATFSLNYDAEQCSFHVYRAFSGSSQKMSTHPPQRHDNACCWKNLPSAHLEMGDIDVWTPMLGRSTSTQSTTLSGALLLCNFSMQKEGNPEAALPELNQIITRAYLLSALRLYMVGKQLPI